MNEAMSHEPSDSSGEAGQERPVDGAASRQDSRKLILVLEQDEEVGTQFVQLIRQATPFQAILATSVPQARTLLVQQKCDVVLLTDSTFPEEDLERLYLLPPEVALPAPLDVTFLSSTSHRGERNAKAVVKAVDLLVSLRDAPPGVLSPLGRFDHEGGVNAFPETLDR
jgi:hypothetical protein